MSKIVAIRLNKYLAQMGVASRRKADVLITSGRVCVDGQLITKLGYQLHCKPKEITVDEVPIDLANIKHSYYVMNKPRGVVTTLKDPEGRTTVADLTKELEERIFPIGRLDYDAEGVLLLTNDGDLALKLTHPRYGTKKTYLVKVKGVPTQATVTQVRKGTKLEDGFAQPIQLTTKKRTKTNSWFEMIVAEGRNRLIKRIWLRFGHPVLKLVRTNFAGIQLGELHPGEIRPLRKDELRKLLK